MIKAVIFDIGGVLIGDVFKPIMEFLRDQSGKDIREVYSARNPHWKALKLGEISETEFWKGFTESIGVSVDIEKLCGMARESMHLMETVPLVKSLKEKGYKLAILSNNAVEWGKYGLDAYDLRKYFDTIILSCDVHLAKPGDKIFKLTLEKIGLDAEDCVFIDNQIENLDAPRDMGVKVIHFKNAEQLRNDLVALGVEL